MKKYIYIGRFQPFHVGHMLTVKRALLEADEVIIFVGSVEEVRTNKNPFTFYERKQMILMSLPDSKRIKIYPLPDVLGYDDTWRANIMLKVDETIEDDIYIIGFNKDSSSYYLKLFPYWGSIKMDNVDGINATDIRDQLYRNQNFGKNISLNTFNYIRRMYITILPDGNIKISKVNKPLKIKGEQTMKINIGTEVLNDRRVININCQIEEKDIDKEFDILHVFDADVAGFNEKDASDFDALVKIMCKHHLNFSMEITK